MIISALVIKKRRALRECETCGFVPPISEPFIRLYGCAETQDKPYVVYICLQCARESTDKKVRKSLRESIGS